VSEADDAMRDRLLGTWRLVSAVREEVPSGARTDLMGPDPQGYITYSPDGRMLVLIVAADRPRPTGAVASPEEAARLFRGMVGYGGTFRVEGDRVHHDVDISWNEAWTGTDQVRRFRLDGDRLILENGPNPDPVDGKVSVRTMTWERLRA